MTQKDTSRSAQPNAPEGEAATVHHRSARRRRGVTSAKMQPNLSSMIDVIFQLLIYFVVTANFAIDEGVLTATLPTGSGAASESLEPPPTTLDIRLTSLGDAGVDIQIGGSGRLGSFTELSNELSGMQFDPVGNPAGVFAADDPVVIRPSETVRWQHVVNAFNAAIKARYTNVNFAAPE